MSRRIASTKITLAIISALVACSSTALAASNIGSRDDGFVSQTSQYCMPQDDSSGTQRQPYC